MSTSGRKKPGSIKTTVQVGFLISSLLALCIVLGISIVVSRVLDGMAGILFLLVMCFAIVLLIFVPLVIVLISQRKIDTIVLDVAEHYRAYSEGNYNVRAPVYGNDSFAVLITTMNGLLERQNRRIEEMAARYAGAAAAPTSPPPTTEPRRSVNKRLRPIDTSAEHKAVSLTTAQSSIQNRQVARALRTMVDRTVFQEQASRAQAIQIFQTTEKIENLALSLHQLTRNIQGSISLAQANLTRLQRGDETLGKTIEELEGLQKGSQRAAQQVYRLSEHTHSIRAFASTIEEVVMHISLLGEHMSMLNTPNTAGQQGQDRQFAVLIQEIMTLANQALEAATQVSTLTNTIEAESHKAVISLQDNNQEVAQKAKLVKESGQMFQDLYRTMEFQASMLKDMAQATSEQTQVVDDASSSMSQIAKMAYQASKETQQNVQGLKKVASVAEQLAQLPSAQEDTGPLLGESSEASRNPFSPKQQLNA